MNWIKIFDNDSFIVEYNFLKRLMRISYFDNYHFQEDCTFTFPSRCLDCKYLTDGMECNHSDAAYCHNGELWWPREEG